MADATGYTLVLSDDEVARYRMMAEHARAAEADLWQLAGFADGAAVADVGCGPGAMFPAIEEAIGSGGTLVGVDGEASTVAAAQALVDANGWANASVRVGRADATGLDAGTFDVVMMRHVLAHNGPTEQAIVDHLAGLVCPGGCVYLVDIDAGGMRLRPPDRDVDDFMAAYARFHAARGNDLQTGLRLRALLEHAGLEVMAYRGWYNIVDPRPGVRPPAWAAREAMVDAGFATAADLERWEQALDRVAEQQPTIFAPLFGAVGRRP